MANERIEWTLEEDKRIATLVLDFVRRGKQVKEALEEFIKENPTPRTLSAARFRWVTVVKPAVQEEYDKAASEGLASIRKLHEADDKRVTPDELIDKIGEFIKQHRVIDPLAQQEIDSLRERVTELEEQIVKLEMERDSLQDELMRR